MNQLSTAMKRAPVLLALLLAAVLGSAPAVVLAPAEAVESAVAQLDITSARDALADPADVRVAPSATGEDGSPDDASMATAVSQDRSVRFSDRTDPAAVRQPPGRTASSYRARAPPPD